MGCTGSHPRPPEQKLKVDPIKDLAYLKTPVFADHPFSVALPARPGGGPRPFVRGIPTDAELLSREETADVLAMLDGRWFLIPSHIAGVEAHVSAKDAMVAYVENKQTSVSHPNLHGRSVEVRRQRQSRSHQHRLFFSRGPDGKLYCDLIGSMFVRTDFGSGKLEFDNALGLKLTWVREGRNCSAVPSEDFRKSQELRREEVYANEEDARAAEEFHKIWDEAQARAKRER